MSRIMALILATCLVSPMVFAQATQPASTTPSVPYPIDPASGSTKSTPANSGGKSVPVAAPPDAAVAAKAEENDKPKVIRVSSGVMAGQLLHKVTPFIPKGTACHVRSDMVVMHAIIGKDGAVRELSVLSGAEPLRQPYMDAVKQWHYKPYLLNGEPVEVETSIMISGNLNGDGC